MAVHLWLNEQAQFFDVNGDPLAGGFLFFYAAGGAVKENTYTTSAGTIPNANPMTLDSAGRLQQAVWLTGGTLYKVGLAVSTETDPPSNFIPPWPLDNVSGVNDFPTSAITGEWVASGFVTTYISGSSFSVLGNQTAILSVGRRLQIVDAGGTKYATITASVFGAGITTVTVLVDGGGILQNPVSSIAYGLISATNTSIPFFVVQNIYPISSAPNPFFQVDQLVNSATSVADDNYGHDHWYVLTQTASVQVSTQALQENGQITNARLTQNQVASQRMGYACILEAKESQKLRGQTMTIKPRIRISASQAVRIAVVEWTGTADAVVSDIVNDWTSSDYTDGAGKFFVDASQAPLGTSSTTPVVATWTDATSLQVTIGASCNNLILFVWTEAVAAQNVTLDIGKVCFVPGTFASNIYMPTFEETLRYAQRFFSKSFLYATAPAQSAGFSTGESAFVSTKAGAVAMPVAMVVKYPNTLRISTGNITIYNPSTASVEIRNVTAGADLTATAVFSSGENGFACGATGTAGTAVGDRLILHWTASARL